jgi:hypothetical protein
MWPNGTQSGRACSDLHELTIEVLDASELDARAISHQTIGHCSTLGFMVNVRQHTVTKLNYTYSDNCHLSQYA